MPTPAKRKAPASASSAAKAASPAADSSAEGAARKKRASAVDDDLPSFSASSLQQQQQQAPMPSPAAEPATFLEAIKQRVRDRMRYRHSCFGMEAQGQALLSMMQDLQRGDSNSVLLLGPPGAGKTALLNRTLRQISQGGASAAKAAAIASASAPFHVARLSASLHPTDKVALRELVRQLVDCGALQGMHTAELEALYNEDEERAREGSKGIHDDADDGGLDEEEGSEEDADDTADSDDEDGQAEAGSRAQRRRAKLKEQGEALKRLEADSVLASVTTMTSHLLSLLGSDIQQKHAKPLLIVLEDLDQFALRPKQALLYVLLDAVQASSYRPGLLVVATASRLDAVDLLEKRVKSRFSERVIHCVLAPTLNAFIRRALDVLLEPEEAAEKAFDGLPPLAEQWAADGKKWNESCRAMIEAQPVKLSLQHDWELYNDVKRVHGTWTRLLARLDDDHAYPTAELYSHVVADATHDTARQLVCDLTVLESVLLAAAVRICYGRTRLNATFAMLMNEIERTFMRNRAAAAACGLGGTTKTDRTKRHARAVAAFRRLVALSVLVPDSIASGLSVPRHLGIPWVNMPHAASIAFMKVRLGVPVPTITAALQSQQRRSVLDPEVGKWAQGHAA